MSDDDDDGGKKLTKSKYREMESMLALRQAKSLRIDELLGSSSSTGAGASTSTSTRDERKAMEEEAEEDGILDEAQKLTAEEEAHLERFMPKSTREQKKLRDVILGKYKAKTKQHEHEQREKTTDADMKSVKSAKSGKSGKSRISRKSGKSMGGGATTAIARQMVASKRMPQAVVKVYRDTGDILARWKSGKLPKAFKIVPKLEDWEEVLYLTKPDNWTSNVMYEAVKMMASQTGSATCQRFYNLVLLPRVREEIAEKKKLDFHLYQALRKATFKVAAFMKGFLLPLCMDEMRAREAVIVGGVLAKKSIPVVHSALAMYKLLEMAEYSGPCHYILKVLLNKRYALPLKVLDALVDHFARFESDVREMPVIWHQCLLTFAERYGASLTQEQCVRLSGVVKRQVHREMTPIVKRHLGLRRGAGVSGSERGRGRGKKERGHGRAGRVEEDTKRPAVSSMDIDI